MEETAMIKTNGRFAQIPIPLEMVNVILKIKKIIVITTVVIVVIKIWLEMRNAIKLTFSKLVEIMMEEIVYVQGKI